LKEKQNQKIKFKADSNLPWELVFPILFVALVMEIVLIGTSIVGMTSWLTTIIPLVFVALMMINALISEKGSYYTLQDNGLFIHSGLLAIQKLNVQYIIKIDQEYESFAKIYRATFVELSRTSLKIRLKNGKRIIVAPLNQKEFITELLKINPDIIVDLKYKT
jgi:hypothetical protein